MIVPAIIFTCGMVAGIAATTAWLDVRAHRRWLRERSIWAAGGPLVLEHMRQEWRPRR